MFERVDAGAVPVIPGDVQTPGAVQLGGGDLEPGRTAMGWPGCLTTFPQGAARRTRAGEAKPHQIELRHVIVGEGDGQALAAFDLDVDGVVSILHPAIMPSAACIPATGDPNGRGPVAQGSCRMFRQALAVVAPAAGGRVRPRGSLSGRSRVHRASAARYRATATGPDRSASLLLDNRVVVGVRVDVVVECRCEGWWPFGVLVDHEDLGHQQLHQPVGRLRFLTNFIGNSLRSKSGPPSMAGPCTSRDSGSMYSNPADELPEDTSVDLAAEFDRLVRELGREQASRIWLERFAAYDEGQT